jgi:hypothetical protein
MRLVTVMMKIIMMMIVLKIDVNYYILVYI